MKKLLLVIIVFATAQIAVGQLNYFTDFNDSIPGEWTIIDADGNGTTWEHNAESNNGVGNSPAAYLDTYISSEDDAGRADDWLISPQLTVSSGDVLTFYARGGYNDAGDIFPDSIFVYATKDASPSVSGFNISLTEIEMDGSDEGGLGELNKYSVVITDNGSIAGGDQIYIGLHCNSNGSSVYVDNFKVAQPNTPLLIDAYAMDKSTIAVQFDEELSSPQVSDFELLDSAGNSFSSMGVIDAQSKMYTLNVSSDLQGDISLDTIIYKNTPDTMMIYGGFMPFMYANLASSETVDKKYTATYTGVVFAALGDEYWVASDSGAYNALRLNGTDSVVAVGDSIIVSGRFSPYNNLTEVYPSHIIKVAATGKDLYPPVEITGADIDTSIAADQLPAEKYENVLVEMKNVTIEKWDGSYYFIGTDGSNKFRIGDDLGFLSAYDSTLLQPTNLYNFTGIVHSENGYFQLNPRDSMDIKLVEDNMAPEVVYFGTDVPNIEGETVKLKSTEGTGSVYLINENADQSTVAELDAAVSNKMGAKAAVTEADTYVELSVEGLTTGFYYGYAVDSANNISVKGEDYVEVVPAVMAEEQTIQVGDPAIVQSTSSTGKVYIVLNEVSISKPADLETAVSNDNARSANVTAANTDIEISTDGLGDGIYDAYAVDENDLMSEKSENQVTVQTTTGIEDVSDTRIDIYPNPAVNHFTINADVSIERVVFYNALGKQVKAVELNNRTDMRINVSDLKVGVYFISFVNEKGIIRTDKLVRELQ